MFEAYDHITWLNFVRTVCVLCATLCYARRMQLAGSIRRPRTKVSSHLQLYWRFGCVLYVMFTTEWMSIRIREQRGAAFPYALCVDVWPLATGEHQSRCLPWLDALYTQKLCSGACAIATFHTNIGWKMDHRLCRANHRWDCCTLLSIRIASKC
eukprot:21567-Heterococcus_DN1.PRE.2